MWPNEEGVKLALSPRSCPGEGRWVACTKTPSTDVARDLNSPVSPLPSQPPTAGLRTAEPLADTPPSQGQEAVWVKYERH